MFPMVPPEEDRQPAFQPTTEEKHLDALYQYAAELLEAGTPPSQARQLLMQQGADARTADLIIDETLLARARDRAGQGNSSPEAATGAATRNMLIGGLVFLVGTLVTVVSCAGARSGGGGYVVAWGAMLWGAIQFFRGFSQGKS